MRLGAEQSDSDDDLLDAQHSNVNERRHTPLPQILDHDDEALLDSSGEPFDSSVQPSIKFRYHYPTFRYSVIFRTIVFLSSLITITLWLSGDYCFIYEIIVQTFFKFIIVTVFMYLFLIC